MSVNVDITVDTSGLLDRSKTQTSVNREVLQEKTLQKNTETEGKEVKRKRLEKSGFQSDGSVLGTPESVKQKNKARSKRATRNDQEPAANRKLKSGLNFFWIGQSGTGYGESSSYWLGSGDGSQWVEIDVTEGPIPGYSDYDSREHLEWAKTIYPDWVDPNGILQDQDFPTGARLPGTFWWLYQPNFIATPSSFTSPYPSGVVVIGSIDSLDTSPGALTPGEQLSSRFPLAAANQGVVVIDSTDLWIYSGTGTNWTNNGPVATPTVAVDPCWWCSPRFASGATAREIDSILALPAGDDKVIVIIRKATRWAWNITWGAVTVECGGTRSADKKFFIPSPYWYANETAFEYTLGRASEGFSINSVSASLRPFPSTDTTQSIEFQLMASQTFREEIFEKFFSEEGITGRFNARPLTAKATVKANEEVTDLEVTGEIEAGDYIWARISFASGGEQTTYSVFTRQELSLTLKTNDSGFIGPPQHTSANFIDKWTTNICDAGQGESINREDAYLITRSSIKRINVPESFKSKVYPRVFGQFVSTIPDEPDYTSTVTLGGSDVLFATGADPREFQFVKAIQGNLRPFYRDPLLPNIEAPYKDPGSVSLDYEDGDMSYYMFPLTLGINDSQISYASEASGYTYWDAVSPVVFDAINDNYKGDGGTLESRAAYGAPAWDLGVNGETGAMTVTDWDFDNPIYEQKIQEMFDLSYVEVFKIEGPLENGQIYEGTKTYNKLPFSPAAAVPLTVSAEEYDNGSFVFYSMYYYTDWGRPSYCTSQLRALGFTEADLQP